MLLALTLTAIAVAASAAETWQVPTRPDVRQPVLVEVPDAPKAAVILFAGDRGGVQFANDRITAMQGNFLLRARAEFQRNGLITAVLGAPSDRSPPVWLDDAFRTSPEHAADVAGVVRALRDRFRVPVWLVGTSRGTLSAAAVALKLGREIDGVVLTATMRSANSLPVEQFAVPVLLGHHEADGCRQTSLRDARNLAARIRAPRSELQTFSGGWDLGPACEARAYHGFNGIEPQVVDAIAKWMLVPGR